MSDGLEVQIDRGACHGAGLCTRRAPRSFRLGPDGKARAITPPGDPEADVAAAAASCPWFAITTVRAGDLR